MDTSNDEGNVVNVEVRFRTSMNKYKVTDKSFQIPVTLNRRGLSQVINHLLGTKEIIPFDFLINDKFLRTTLDEFYKKNNISYEEIVVIDYIELQDPPSVQTETTHTDWISAIDNNLILLNKKLPDWEITEHIIPYGSYDNQVCVFFTGNDEKKSITIGTHEQPVLAVSSFCREEKTVDILSASQDNSVFLWKLNLEDKSSSLRMKLNGHDGAVEDVAYSPSGNLAASCGWDQKVLIWTFTDESFIEQFTTINNKRKKKDIESNETQIMNPRSSFEGHMQAISSLKWISEDQILTGSWDHSLRFWDVDSGICTNQLHGNKVILSVDYSNQNNMVVTGHADKSVRLWDPRVKSTIENNNINTTLHSHKNWVSCVKWHPSNSNLFVSVSYDTNVKIWDIRAKTPLYSLNSQHKEKIFTLSWLSDNNFVTGGADQNLLFYSFPESSN